MCGRDRLRHRAGARAGHRSRPPTRAARAPPWDRATWRVHPPRRARRSRTPRHPRRRRRGPGLPNRPSTHRRSRTAASTSGSSMTRPGSGSVKRARRRHLRCGRVDPVGGGRSRPGTRVPTVRARAAPRALPRAATVPGATDSPRTTRSWAATAATGPGVTCGARSTHVWVDAATSASGPIAKRPASSTSIAAAYSGGRVAARAGTRPGSPRATAAGPVRARAARGRGDPRELPLPRVAQHVDDADQLVEIARIDRGGDARRVHRRF